MFDHKDRCPGTPFGTKVDEQGCPQDTDMDGVFDHKDRCPGTPFGTKVDEQGCSADTDQDEVLNDDDRCPGTPFGVKVDERGCAIVEKKSQLVVLPGDVTFASNESVLTPQAETTLDELVNQAETHLIQKIEVVGHTDSIGEEDYNQRLSEQRAESVADYLKMLGVSSDKITQWGYGEHQPVESNDTNIDRARNRRVELKITRFQMRGMGLR